MNAYKCRCCGDVLPRGRLEEVWYDRIHFYGLACRECAKELRERGYSKDAQVSVRRLMGKE